MLRHFGPLTVYGGKYFATNAFGVIVETHHPATLRFSFAGFFFTIQFGDVEDY